MKSIIWGSAYDRDSADGKPFIRQPAKGRIMEIEDAGDKGACFVPFKEGTLDLEPGKMIPMSICYVSDTKSDAVSQFNQAVKWYITRTQKKVDGLMGLYHDGKGLTDDGKLEIWTEIKNYQKELASAYEDLILSPVSELEIPLDQGSIKAHIIEDDEYPGISLCYAAAGNGEPGAVLECVKETGLIRMHVWDMDTVDSDPKYSLDLSEKAELAEVKPIVTSNPAPILVEMPLLLEDVDADRALQFVNSILKTVFPERNIILFSHKWNSVIEVGQAAWSVQSGFWKKIEYLELSKPTAAFKSLLKCLANDYQCEVKWLPAPALGKKVICDTCSTYNMDPAQVMKEYRRSGMEKLSLQVILYKLYGCKRTYEVRSDILYIVNALWEPNILDMELFLGTIRPGPVTVKSICEVDLDEKPLPDYIGEVCVIDPIYGMPLDRKGDLV